jgi:uncharacterized protein YlxW (UPF0749 family)
MLREQMDKLEAMHERERQTLVSQVEDLKVEAERRSREHMKTLAVLTDQLEKSAEPRRRFFGLLKGSGASLALTLNNLNRRSHSVGQLTVPECTHTTVSEQGI